MQELEAEANRGMLFAGLVSGSYLTSYTAQAFLPEDGAAHGGLRHPTGISSLENDPQTYPQINLMKTILQLRFLLPMCVKLTTNQSWPC